MGEKTASELAQETLRQLTVRKLTPIPANYRVVFNEIGGLSDDTPFPVAQEPASQADSALVLLCYKSRHCPRFLK